MSIYESILGLDNQAFEKLMSKGFLRSNAKRDLDMYEYYLSQLHKGKMQALTNTAIKFNMSEDRCKAIIYKIRNLCTNC